MGGKQQLHLTLHWPWAELKQAHYSDCAAPTHPKLSAMGSGQSTPWKHSHGHFPPGSASSLLCLHCRTCAALTTCARCMLTHGLCWSPEPQSSVCFTR